MKKDKRKYKKVNTRLPNTLGTKVTRELYDMVNELVAQGHFSSKSEAVLRGLEMLVDMHKKTSTVPLSEMKSATTSIKTPDINYSVAAPKSNQDESSGRQEKFYAKHFLENIHTQKQKAQYMGESISELVRAILLLCSRK